MSVRCRTGPRHPRLGALVERAARPVLRAMFARHRFHHIASAYARERLSAVQAKLRRGETVHLLGLGPAGHNSGVSLVEVGPDRVPRVLCNHEEERFTGRKHCTDFPDQALAHLRRQMHEWGVEPARIDACLATWDYAALSALLLRTVVEEGPDSLAMSRPGSFAGMGSEHLFQASRAAYALGSALGTGPVAPIVGLPHHDNHAFFSFGVSPFASSGERVLVMVLDGFGDDGSISFYLAEDGRLSRTHSNHSVFDSLGVFYSMISSTQGGWTILSSEGRYMGASAWGDGERLTNPFYPGLRQVFHLDGPHVLLNRALANWPRRLFREPYTADLRRVLGDPIPLDQMWNPDAVLRVEDIRHREDTRDRLDKAAATQLVFEDVLFHLVGRLVRATGSSRLVLTGGTALNGLATMRLLEAFDEEFYERHLRLRNTRLHVWTPPTPGDAGVTMGAAYRFAVEAGAGFGPPLQHAFYCGSAPTTAEISEATRTVGEIGALRLEDALARDGPAVADLMASITAADGVIALFQGPAETGPRALGHRSILANPCNPRTRERLNELVKYREAIRPLAPMVTLREAHRLFELSPGAADDQYNAYNYMVLTARARPEAVARVSAVVHRDGTSRLQIVRRDHDPLVHAYLTALGRRLGVEVAVNTSFNVAGPIVQTPVQALETLKRSRGMDGVFLVSREGAVFVAWHQAIGEVKDGGRWLRGWIEAWVAARSGEAPRAYA